MFAIFNLGLMEVLVLGVFGLALLAGAVVLAVVLANAQRRRPIEPEDDAPPRYPPGGGVAP